MMLFKMKKKKKASVDAEKSRCCDFSQQFFS